MEAVNTELSGLNQGQKENPPNTRESTVWKQAEEEENKARSRRGESVLRRKTGGNADQAELPVKEWRMKEQRGETGPQRSDGALQRSMRRASIIQQLWIMGQHAEEVVQIRGREREDVLHSFLLEMQLQTVSSVWSAEPRDWFTECFNTNMFCCFVVSICHLSHWAWMQHGVRSWGRKHVAADIQSLRSIITTLFLQKTFQRKEGENQNVPVVLNLRKSPKLNTSFVFVSAAWYSVHYHKELILTFHI